MSAFRFMTLVVVPFLGVALAGCHSRTTDASTPAEPEKLSLFQKGKGVCLPDELKKEFGVETVEVAEKPLPRRLTKTARVYRAASDGERAAASVLVTTEEAQELKPGQAVVLRRAHDDEAPFSGTLVRMDEHARQVLGQVELLVEFADAARRFPVGAFLSASFTTREPKPVFVVPETAVLRCADGCYVYAVNGVHLTRTPVKIGAKADGLVEVEDGLYAGDAVVRQGIENLWLVELSALKGGTPCCPVPKKGAEK